MNVKQMRAEIVRLNRPEETPHGTFKKRLAMIFMAPRSTRTFTGAIPAGATLVNVLGCETAKVEASANESGIVTLQVSNPYDYQLELRPVLEYKEKKS